MIVKKIDVVGDRYKLITLDKQVRKVPATQPVEVGQDVDPNIGEFFRWLGFFEKLYMLIKGMFK